MGPPTLALSPCKHHCHSTAWDSARELFLDHQEHTFPHHRPQLGVVLVGMCFTCEVQQQESIDASDQGIKKEAIHTKECLVKFENHSGSNDTEVDHLLHLYLLMWNLLGFFFSTKRFVTDLK